MARSCVGLQASVVLLFLLLLGGQSVAVAPGDEDERCPVPQYPVHVKVLMDSWRYHTLIAGDRRVWTATTSDRRRMTPETVASKNNGSKVRSYTDTIHPYLQWSSQGTCNGGSVSVCAGGHREKRLLTQFINKSLPESHTDPLRIYVNVTYSFTDCLGMQQHCDVELLRATNSNGYGSDGIMPDNLIEYTSSVSSGTKQFFFDSSTSVTGFYLALRSRDACVTVSRVLVYRYECPGSDRIPPTSLLRRPATPVNVSSGQIRPVTPYCADNAHLRDETLTIACGSGGRWNDGGARCECNSGYREDEEGTTCKGRQLHNLHSRKSLYSFLQRWSSCPFQRSPLLHQHHGMILHFHLSGSCPVHPHFFHYLAL